jgi:hypothetical protein
MLLWRSTCRSTSYCRSSSTDSLSLSWQKLTIVIQYFSGRFHRILLQGFSLIEEIRNFRHTSRVSFRKEITDGA